MAAPHSLLPPPAARKGSPPIFSPLQAAVLHRFARPKEGESKRQENARLCAGALALAWVRQVEDFEVEGPAMLLVIEQLADLTGDACKALN